MNLRYFELGDAGKVKELFFQTFKDSEGLREGRLIKQLVDDLISKTDDKDLIGFVSEQESTLSGSVFFSRVRLIGQGGDSSSQAGKAFLLSPMAVATSMQSQGVGQKLIRFGLDNLKDAGVSSVFTYGDPAYYGKFGFQSVDRAIVIPPYRLTQPEGWLAKSLGPKQEFQEEVRMKCVSAFDKEVYW